MLDTNILEFLSLSNIIKTRINLRTIVTSKYIHINEEKKKLCSNYIFVDMICIKQNMNTEVYVPCLPSAQKMRFPIKNFFSKCGQNHSVDLFTFTKYSLNRKLFFFFEVSVQKRENAEQK